MLHGESSAGIDGDGDSHFGGCLDTVAREGVLPDVSELLGHFVGVAVVVRELASSRRGDLPRGLEVHGAHLFCSPFWILLYLEKLRKAREKRSGEREG